MDETSRCCEKKPGSSNGAKSGPTTTYGSMEVADNSASTLEPSPDARAGGDHKGAGDIELARSIAKDDDSIVWDPKPCNCVANGPKCHECLAADKDTLKVQMESWSVEKTVIFGVILGAFLIWAVVFGVCLNVFKL